MKLPELAVIEVGGFYYLQSSEFKCLNSAEEVREKSKVLIKLINDSMKLIIDDFHNIEEDGVTPIGNSEKRIHHVFLEARIKLRARAKAKIEVKSEANKHPDSQSSLLEQLVHTAKNDNSFAEVMHFFSKNTWIDLYKVYEIIKDDIGGKHNLINNKWATESELNRFTQTAQSKDAIGDDARHASKKYKPHSEPLSFNDAKSLIKRIINRWPNSKDVKI